MAMIRAAAGTTPVPGMGATVSPRIDPHRLTPTSSYAISSSRMSSIFLTSLLYGQKGNACCSDLGEGRRSCRVSCTVLITKVGHDAAYNVSILDAAVPRSDKSGETASMGAM
jgi:hypothetical protein